MRIFRYGEGRSIRSVTISDRIAIGLDALPLPRTITERARNIQFIAFLTVERLFDRINDKLGAYNQLF